MVVPSWYLPRSFGLEASSASLSGYSICLLDTAHRASLTWKFLKAYSEVMLVTVVSKVFTKHA